MKKSLLVAITGLFFVLAIQGCGKTKITTCNTPGDTPQNHYVAGMVALEEGKYKVAEEKFRRAIYCDKDFSSAYGGLAIVFAYRATQHKDSDYSNAERTKATDYMKTDAKKAHTAEDKFERYLSVIRVNIIMCEERWLSKAENAYRLGKTLSVDETGLLYYQGVEALDYYMGLAYIKAFELQKARTLFSKVLNGKKDGKWHAYADKAWERTDKIERAFAGTALGDIGKKIAVQDTVSHRDLSLLLVNELRLERFFSGPIPAQKMAEKAPSGFMPVDIASDPFKEEILTVLKWNIRGLEPTYDATSRTYLFKPDDIVTRGEMALVLEDIIIRLTGDENIVTAYLGHNKSPFQDVKPTSPLYNAITDVTTRGIMEPDLTGTFRVNDPVDGAAAVLAIRLLKQKINVK